MAQPRHRVAWVLLALAVTGAALWLATRRAGPASPAADPHASDLEERVEALQGALALERAAREALAQELAELQLRTEWIADALAADPGRRVADAEDASDVSAAERAARAARAESSEADAPLFDVEALVAGCMPRVDAEALRARWERHELDRIQLNDAARREGYFMRPRHRREHLALETALRGDLGEAGYDAYLRATGKPNRVEVKAVLPEGAGRAAGLEAGDELERYAGARVFTVGNLHGLTAGGRLGETVSVEVVRNGRPLTLRVPRGPLGIVLEPVTRAPPGDC
ncbi:MAG: PDZ domain-containing protein [Myxococcota bacterium]